MVAFNVSVAPPGISPQFAPIIQCPRPLPKSGLTQPCAHVILIDIHRHPAFADEPVRGNGTGRPTCESLPSQAVPGPNAVTRCTNLAFTKIEYQSDHLVMSNALVPDRTALQCHSQDPGPYVRCAISRTAANCKLGQPLWEVEHARTEHLIETKNPESSLRSSISSRDALRGFYKSSG